VDLPKAALPSIKLKPRISIKPSEPERANEATSVPESLPAVPSVSSDPSAPLGSAGEKVRIELRPLAKPPEAGLPVGAIPPGRSAGDEKTEAGAKFKLKPAMQGNAPKTAARSGLGESKPPAASITLPAAGHSPAGPTAFKNLPTLLATPNPRGIPAPAKPQHGAMLRVLMGLLVLCVVGYLWFFVRAPKSAVAAHSPSSEAQPRPSSVGKTGPRDQEIIATEHPAPVGDSSAKATAGAPAVRPSDTPGAPPLESAAAPTAAAPPPPPVPTVMFRTFVDHLKISGVRTGPPARLFVDGVAYHPGDVMDRALGLVFVGVDAATSEIIFKDSTGAEVRRRF
jgi:hypothetical protein